MRLLVNTTNKKFWVVNTPLNCRFRKLRSAHEFCHCHIYLRHIHANVFQELHITFETLLKLALCSQTLLSGASKQPNDKLDLPLLCVDCFVEQGFDELISEIGRQ